jgi:hypothetical protein
MAVSLPAVQDDHRFVPQKNYFSVSGTHFCYRLSKPLDLVRVEGLGNFSLSLSLFIKNINLVLHK